MKRRTLDLIFASGGIVVAALLVVLGFALSTQYAFATDYVRTELGAQKISFATADKLTAEDTSWKPGSVCLVKYAGQPVETGAQAECFAKYYIAMHMSNSAINAGFPGATYATLGATQTDLRGQIAAAKAKGDTTAASDLQKKLDAATSLRSTMQTGETLRGLLLTTYGFSVLGDMAGLAANLIYALAIILVGLSIAGYIHALFTSKEEIVFAGAARPTTVAASA